MLLYAFLALVAACSLLTLQNWRRGIYFMILIAAIQDPVRKMVPGTPGYLVLATVPVWVAMILGAGPYLQPAAEKMTRSFPRLGRAVRLFLLSMVPAAFLSATYGPGSWQITLMGLFSYGSILLGILMGYAFPRREGDLRRVLAAYCLITAVMMIGTPLDYLGLAPGWNAVGTRALGFDWISTAVYGVIVKLYAGFYRTPDVMGWHAASLVMLAGILALNRPGLRRYGWLTLAAGGLVAALLCGRRKMIYMLPVFVFFLVWLNFRLERKRMNFRTLLLVFLVAIFAGYSLYQIVGPSEATEAYYFRNPQTPLERLRKHGLDALFVTYRQSGFWGEGLGTATLGKHHLHVTGPRTWQEGGLGRLLVELGVPGLLCALYLGLVLVRNGWDLVRRRIDPSLEGFFVRAGLFAFLAANAGSFVISHQIFGDPFVNVFMAFILGMVLSGARSVAAAGAPAPSEKRGAGTVRGLPPGRNPLGPPQSAPRGRTVPR